MMEQLTETYACLSEIMPKVIPASVQEELKQVVAGPLLHIIKDMSEFAKVHFAYVKLK